MWLATMKDYPLASQEAGGAVEAYHLKLKSKLYDDSQLGSLQRVDWLVHKLTTEIHSSYWLDRYADESGSFETVKEEYIASTSWHRAMQIPDDAVKFIGGGGKDQNFAKVASQKDPRQERTVWNPGSEFALCDCSWSMQGNLCKHAIKVSMLSGRGEEGHLASMSGQSFRQVLDDLWRMPADDSVGLDQAMAWAGQIQDKVRILVELCNSANIGSVVNNLPLKWVTKKGRTFVGKPPLSFLALPPGSTGTNTPPKRRSRKRKRLSRLRGS